MSKIRCQFVSVWGSNIAVSTEATYDPDTKTFEILETADDDDNQDVLIREYLEFPDGETLDVCTQCHDRVLETRMIEGVGKSLEERKVCPDCDGE